MSGPPTAQSAMRVHAARPGKRERAAFRQAKIDRIVAGKGGEHHTAPTGSGLPIRVEAVNGYLGLGNVLSFGGNDAPAPTPKSEPVRSNWPGNSR